MNESFSANMIYEFNLCFYVNYSWPRLYFVLIDINLAFWKRQRDQVVLKTSKYELYQSCSSGDIFIANCVSNNVTFLFKVYMWPSIEGKLRYSTRVIF